MNTFNVKISFTPAYHPASNGAIERRHQTIKNALKASLIDMGNQHGDQWMRALPWVLLGKRIQVQPDLDASSALLVFGKSLSIPGQLLQHPGPPLTNLQTKALLNELYKMASKPAIQTTSVQKSNDISITEGAQYVYVKVHEPKHGLSPRFEGPFKVISRPSRSQVQVRVGSFVDGRPRLSTFHWSSCKLAKVRDDFQEASRPNIGRKPNAVTTSSDNGPEPTEAVVRASPTSEVNKQNGAGRVVPKRGKIQTSGRTKTNTSSLGCPEPAAPSSSRPTRATRNPNPVYIDGISV